MIKEIREICERYTGLGVPNFPTGIPFTFWEQYLPLTTDLFIAILMITGTVLLMISIIIFNPWAASMVEFNQERWFRADFRSLWSLSSSRSNSLASWAFLASNSTPCLRSLSSQPLEQVSFHCLLLSHPFSGVEFTAYIILSFLAALGTRNDRMAACLEHMYIPVVHGGISALLGIVMLAFTPFEFIFKYFFVVMAVLIIIGMFNGVAMFPVLLSLFGPPSEVDLEGFSEKKVFRSCRMMVRIDCRYQNRRLGSSKTERV